MNFFPIHIQHFTSDSNSKYNNSQGFKNSRMDIRGCVWVGESFLSHDKWQIKLLSEFLYNFMSDSNSENNNSRVLKIHNVLGDVYEVRQSFLSHDKWHIKLVSEFFPNSHSTFYEWL